MMDKLVHFCVHNRLFVFLTTAILCVYGVNTFQTLPIDALPDISNVQVQVNTATKGLVPQEVERMVTVPVEYAMNGIPGVETVRSLSKYGISQVTVIFKDDTDLYRARQLITERLQNLNLPQGMRPELGPMSTGLGEIFHYGLMAKGKESEEMSLEEMMELRTLQEWVIKPRLLSVAGITEVNTVGGHAKQFFIRPDIIKMAKHGLHFSDIENAIRQTNQNVGGGYIQQTGQQLLVRGVGLLNNFQDLENVIVKRLSDYEVVLIKDIAKVAHDKEIRTGAATYNGREIVLGSTFMLVGENSRAVAQAVYEEIQLIKKDLPDWVDLKVLYNRSKMVNTTLKTIEANLLMGAGLVSLFLILLLGNIRAALITSLVIPIALLITFILMKWQKVSGNLMSLGALDFGIIVDGAVIVTENCVRRIQEKKEQLKRALTRSEVRSVAHKASVEIRSAAGFGELIVIIVFVPLFALTGVEGKMFGPMALTFIFALASALVLSFTLVPALCATFLSGDAKVETPFFMRLAYKLFAPSLKLALRFKKIVLGIALSSIVLGVALFSFLGSEFIPQLDEGDFSIQFIRPANISIDNSIAIQRLSEEVIRSFDQVEHVFATTGSAEVASDPMGVNITDAYVILKPKDLWPKDSNIQTKDDLVSAVEAKLKTHLPLQAIMPSQPVQLRFNELLEGTRADISLKIYGENLDLGLELALKSAKIIETLPDAGDVETESVQKIPMLEFRPKLDELSALGMSARPVLDTVEVAIGGRDIGTVYQGVRSYPIVLRLAETDRQDLDRLKKIPVGVGDSYTAPLDQLAYLSFENTYSSINREKSERRVAVLINPKTSDVEGFVENVKQKLEEQLKIPEGFYLEWGGTFKNLQSAKRSLMILVPLAFILIIAMLYAAFRSFAQVVLIFLCAPLSLVGGVIALQLMNMPFSISAGVGFIALSGISILNGVVLVSYFNRLRQKGKSPDDVVFEGAMGRLRPVLMTAFTDIFGFLPMMFSTGLGAEVQRPLATVVVGGMISATFLTLVVIPSLYRLFIRFMPDDQRS